MLTTIQFLYVIFVFLGRPHKKPFDFVRSLVIEISLLFILLSRYLYVEVLGAVLEESSSVYSIMSFIELGAYGVSIVLSIASLIYHLVKKFRRNKIQPD